DCSLDIVKTKLQEVYSIVLSDSNINLSFKTVEEHKNSYTIYLNYSGPLGADIKRGQIKTDFTIKEHLINPPVNKLLLRCYEQYYDIPENIELIVYTLEEIFIEKCLCVINRNEPRDVYDLWYLSSNQCLDFKHLASEIKTKGIAKDSKYLDIINALNTKRKNFESLWKTRLQDQMTDLPHFDKVYRELTRELKPINISD
ncbi:MAG: nucleotidyl transferase AbiEii/AbiGii toxin family protein, partial [Candidatus Firestonebacteria bacterium]